MISDLSDEKRWKTVLGIFGSATFLTSFAAPDLALIESVVVDLTNVESFLDAVTNSIADESVADSNFSSSATFSSAP